MKIKPHYELWAARIHAEMKFFTICDVEKEQLGMELGMVTRKMESQLTPPPTAQNDSGPRASFQL